MRHNGQQVLMLGVVMTDDGNIVELGKALETAVAKVQSELPYGVELERVADQPTVVSESVWEFERSLLEALAIVLVVCLVSLGWRTGIVVGLSVPIVLGVVALVMLAMGWNLERVSLGSLIIALGLLVDDGIIAVEMMVVKMEEGWDRVKAAAFSYAATAMPRLTGALITTAAFMPIGFSKSTTGEYAGGIFWIVGTAVVFSWFVSGVITPYLAVKMLPDFKKHGHGGDPYRTPFYRKLRGWIDFAIARRWWVIGATAAAFALAVVGSRLVPQQFFPNSDRPELVVELRLKEGVFVRRDDRAGQEDGGGARQGRGRQVLHRVHRRRPAALLSVAQSGAAEPGLRRVRRHDQGRGGARTGALAPDGDASTTQFPDVWVRVTRLELGPPVGFPVQFRVVGPDTQKVREIAREVEAVVAASPKVRDVQLDWNDPVRTLRVDIDQDKARALGLAPADVAFVTQTLHERRHAVAAARARRPGRHRRARGAVRAPQPRHAEGRQPLHARGHRRAAVAGRARAQRARRAGAVAAQPRHGDHRARRRQGRRAGRVGDQGDPAAAEGHRGEAAVGLSHRRRRRRRGKRQGQQGAGGGVPGDAGHDPGDPDAAAAELLEDVHGAAHRARSD